MKLFVFFLLIPGIVFASASSPTEYIRVNVDSVIMILKETQGDTAEVKHIQAERISSLIDDFFDPQELSRRSLGQYWRLFSPAQQLEFQELFLKLIKQVYLKKSIAYNNEQVTFDKEVMKTEALAEVFTTIVASSAKTSVIYYLKRVGSSWKVYDISVENVSFVKNYRSQFQSILQNNPPAYLLSVLREKTHE